MKYILIDETYTDWFVEEFETKEEALESADYHFRMLTERDKKAVVAFYVLESVNPNEDAVNHFDGDIVKKYI